MPDFKLNDREILTVDCLYDIYIDRREQGQRNLNLMSNSAFSEEDFKKQSEQCGEALDLLRAQDYVGAQDILEKLSNDGNLVAKTDLAKMHFDKLVKNPDFTLAKTLINEAINNKFWFAYNVLGSVFELGKGEEVDLKKAFDCYDLAAKNGDGSGMYNKGRFYYFGIGTRQNIADAIMWFGKAAHKDNEKACFLMGEILLSDEHLERDLEMATNFFERGATLGSSDCQNRLGIMYQKGLGRQKDFNQAYSLFMLSSLQNDPLGHYLLGAMYMNGVGIEKDVLRAFELFTKSADQGLAEAHLELGAIYGKGEVTPKDRQKSIRHYEIAAKQGNALANSNLGIIYLNGDGADQNVELGVEYLAKAAQLGDDGAKSMLVELKQKYGIDTGETPDIQ